MKHNLLKFALKKLKDNSIKTPPPPSLSLYQYCGLEICMQHGLGVICNLVFSM